MADPEFLKKIKAKTLRSTISSENRAVYEITCKNVV